MAQEETFHYVRTLTLPFYERMCKSMLKSKLRKHRRVVSLLMAIVMVFAFMSMTASAAVIDDPVITPKGTCPSCTNGYMETVYGSVTRKADGPWSSSCQNIGAGHQHYYHYFDEAYTLCRNCGYINPVVLRRTYCPYNGYVS